MRTAKGWFTNGVFVTLAVASAANASSAKPPADRFAAAQQRVVDSEYEISRQGTSWQAPNRAQNFRTTFAGEGIRLAPRVDQATSWTWGLTLTGVGRTGALKGIEPATLHVDGKRITYDRSEIVEWYVNDQRGVEQGFTLRQAPTRARGEVSIDLSLTGTLDPSMTTDRQAIDFVAQNGARVLRYAQLKVVDATGRELPAHMDVSMSPELRGIRLVYDDVDAVYPVTVDPLTFAAVWTAEGNQDGANFGTSVATAGDVNNDGYSDVIIGAPNYDNGQPDEGTAFVFLGSASGLATTAAWTAENDRGGASFGQSVASAGDVNGDGFADVIVGAPSSFDLTGGGHAYVYLGSASGLGPTPAWTIADTQIFGNFGRSVASAGDVNGDGFADVIVGHGGYSNNESGEGRAVIYFGSAAGLATVPAWTVEGNQPSANFGSSVATAGDVNGDGFADVIVGANLYDYNNSNEGRAFVYLGSASGPGAFAAWTAQGDQVNAGLGNVVGTAGDVNGDGYADVIVGASEFNTSQLDAGKVFVYLGSAAGPAAAPAWTVQAEQNSAFFGFSAATAGDINGDGYADVVVGAFNFNEYDQVREGIAYAYFGSAAGLATTPDWSDVRNQNYSGYGVSVAAAGDVNGDGFGDIIVGASNFDSGSVDEGKAFVYYGSATATSTTASWTVDGTMLNEKLGGTAALAGDVNGDGYSDVVVGTFYYENGQAQEGAAFVYLGSAAGLATSPSWSGEGNQVSARFGISAGTAGDVNGDGYSDLIVGAPGFGVFPNNFGRAFVYLGSSSGLSATPAWVKDGDLAFSGFGASVASAGDVNGDGYSDVIIGSDGNVGRASIFLGSPAGLATTAWWTAAGGQPFSLFGGSVGTAGDVNRDGYSDVIIGAYRFDNGQTDEGRAFVYLGAPDQMSVNPVWTAESDRADAFFGCSVSTAGDVNGDGYSDVIVGASHYDAGRVYVYLGGPGGVSPSPFVTVLGVNALYGEHVAAAGDTNGDGYADVIISERGAGNRGQVFVLHGSAAGFLGTLTWVGTGEQAFADYGASVGSAGDVNGDGYADVLVGSETFGTAPSGAGRVYCYYGGGGHNVVRLPRQLRADGSAPIALLGKSESQAAFRLTTRGSSAAGRAKLRLQWEVKPLGTSFTGTGTGLSSVTDSGAPGGMGSAATIDAMIAGLGTGNFYHWRLRAVSADPLFPHSPWISIAGDTVTETKLRTTGCADVDGDGYGAFGDPSCASLRPDCNDADPAVWFTPGETGNLRFSSGKTILSWDVPTAPGAITSTLVYDVIRSIAASDFLFSTCIESDDGPNTTATDGATPAVGLAFFYLVRAQNACPTGVGALGTDTAGIQRLGRTCP